MSSQSNGLMMDGLFIFLSPAVYLGAGWLSMVYFGGMYGAVHKLAKTAKLKGWPDFLRLRLLQIFKTMVPTMEKTFGKPEAWAPSLTHVLLAALIIAVTYGFTQLRNEIADAKALLPKKPAKSSPAAKPAASGTTSQSAKTK